MSEISGSYGKSMFVRYGYFPEKLYHLTFLPTIYESFNCSTFLLALDIVSIFYYGHCNKCVMVSLHGSNSHFLIKLLDVRAPVTSNS